MCSTILIFYKASKSQLCLTKAKQFFKINKYRYRNFVFQKQNYFFKINKYRYRNFVFQKQNNFLK